MSLATSHSVSCCELLKALLVAHDERVSQEHARVLVLTHKCKWCRVSFAELVKKSQSLIFMEDSRRAVHDLCSDCANMLFETDPGANEIDLSELKEDDCVRRIIFGIMVGELRHTQFKGTAKVQIPSSIQQSEDLGSVQGRKPGFVRRHPARRGMAISGGKH